MAKPKEIATALWLVPEGEAADWLQHKIDDLARQFEATPFRVHLTLGLGPASLLEQIQSQPFELEMTSVEASERFTKSVFVRCELTPELAALRKSLGLPANDFDPHLSLLYADLPLEQKRHLAHSIQIPFARVRFASVAAIRCALPVATAADVAEWVTLVHKPLPRT